MENTPSPAPNAPNTPPATPSVNPAPIYQLSPSVPVSPTPAPPTPASPTLSPAATIVKTAGFFSGKVLVSLIAVVVVGGGLAAGYFFFPEPFYNSVGKYLGLPSPSEEVESETEEDEMDAAAEDSETREVASKDIAPSELFEMLPGANANVILVFTTTPDFEKAIESANKKLAQMVQDEKKPLPEVGNSELSYIGSMKRATPFTDLSNRFSQFKGIEEVIFVGKISPEQFSMGGYGFREEDLSAALGVKVTMEKIQEFEKLAAQAKEKPDAPAVESKGNGVFIITNPKAKEPLTGKLSENKLLSAIKTSEANFALAMDIRESIRQWLEENPPKPDELNDPAVVKQFEALKKARDFTLFASVSAEEEEIINISISAQLGMEDAAAATELLTLGQETLDQFIPFLPPDFQALLSLDLKQEENFVRLEITFKDIETIGKKVWEQFLAPMSIRPMGKPINDESPADLPNLNELEPSILEELKRSDIPGAPIGGIERIEESEPVVSGGKIRRIKK